MSVYDDLHKLIQRLEQEHDQLKLNIHLAKAEARDEWERLEKQWGQLRAKLPQARAAVEETTENIAHSAKQIAEDIQRGYERLRRLM